MLSSMINQTRQELFILMVSRTKNMTIIIHTAYIYCLIFKSRNCFFENVIIKFSFLKIFLSKISQSPFFTTLPFWCPSPFQFFVSFAHKAHFWEVLLPLNGSGGSGGYTMSLCQPVARIQFLCLDVQIFGLLHCFRDAGVNIKCNLI